MRPSMTAYGTKKPKRSSPSPRVALTLLGAALAILPTALASAQEDTPTVAPTGTAANC